MIRRALLATTALVASVTAAHAEPISLSIAAITAFLSSTTIAGISLGTILQGAIFLGGLLAPMLFGGARGRRIDPGELKNTLELAEGEEIRALGRVRIGGLKVYGNSKGFNRWRLIAHCRGPISAVEEYFLGGRSVVVEADGAVSSPPYVRPGVLSYIYVRGKVGTTTETAYTQLTSEFPGVWTTDHRGRGIAQSLIQYISPGVNTTKFGRMFQSGVPDLELIIRGEQVFDVRTNTTGWTDNAVLIIRHVLLGLPEWSNTMLDDGFNAAEANRADVLVPTLTGTEKRARLWGVFTSEMGREEVLSALLMSAGARIILRPGGKWGIQLIDDVQTAAFEFVERDIVDWGWKSGPDGVDRPNLCRVKYYSPEVGYDLAEINTGPGTAGASWARITSEITAYGEKPMDLELPFCPSASQAQRIARRMFAVARADSGRLDTNMAGMAAWGCPTASIPLPDLDETVIAEIDAPRIDADGYTVNIPYRVWPTLPTWNPAAMESPAPTVVPDLAFQSDVATPSAMSDAIVVQYIASGIRETRVRIYPPSGVPTVEANYRTYTAGLPNAWQSMSEFVPTLLTRGIGTAWVTADLTGEEADFRSRALDADENGSATSPTYSTTIALSTGAPASPALSSGDVSGVFSAIITPTDMKTVRFVSTRNGRSPVTHDNIRGAAVSRAIGGASGDTVTIQVTPFATGNVAGTPVSITVTIP